MNATLKMQLLVSMAGTLFAIQVFAVDFQIPAVRYPEAPKVTIITSVFKSDAYIKGFLEDIVQQTIFPECELLMINAHSPGNEEPIILEYAQKYSNITYIKLEADPGIYGVWNMGLTLARSEYVTNANTDDRVAHTCYELHAQTLDQYQDIDLVYSDFYCTKGVNETIEHNSACKVSQLPEYNPGYMYLCLPNNHPMWRLRMHRVAGNFNEVYKSAGDWEMWLRAIVHGSVFKKVPGILGLYYRNPKGLSTDIKKQTLIRREIKKIRKQYEHLFFAEQNYPRYKKISRFQLNLKDFLLQVAV